MSKVYQVIIQYIARVGGLALGKMANPEYQMLLSEIAFL